MITFGQPYRFNVYGVNFDVSFDYVINRLEYDNQHAYRVTLAFARKVNTVKTLAAKTVRNPSDTHDKIIGYKKAFERIINLVWANWCDPLETSRKEFATRAWQISFDAGMWNDEE